jgi:hypothetical protein
MEWQRYITGFQKSVDAESQSHFFFMIHIPENHSAFSHSFSPSETSSVIHTTFDVCGWTQRLSELRIEYANPICPGDTLLITACSVECSEDRIRVALAISNKQGYSVARAEAIFEASPQSYSTMTQSPLREDVFFNDAEEDERLERMDEHLWLD